MFVSVVIPSYRQPQFLGRAIASVLEQDFQNLELLIVDDRALDESLAIAIDAMQCDPRVRVLSRRTNGGLGRARNTGLMASRGSLITFLDSDDYLLPGSIQSRVDVWNGLTDRQVDTTVGVYGDWQHIGENIDDLSNVRKPRSGLPVLSAANYAGENLFICSSPLLRPDALVAVGGFAESVEMLEDYAAWARLLAAGASFVPAESIVCTYRQRQSSMLRGKASTFIMMVDDINRWLGENGVEIHHQRGDLNALANKLPPKSVRRVNWLRPIGFRVETPANTQYQPAPVDHDTPDTKSKPRDIAFMNRTATDLEGVLEDVDEFIHTKLGPHRARVAVKKLPTPRAVFAPNTLEESLDAVALTHALLTVGCPARLVMSRPRTTSTLWPAVLSDTHRLPIDALPEGVERFVLFADGGPLRQTAVKKFSRDKLALRTSGIDALNVYARGAARRYREGDTVLVRSRLEAAELCGRPVRILPSGVHLAAELLWGQRDPTDDIVILISSYLASIPWMQAWTRMTLAAVQKMGTPIRLMASTRVVQGVRTELRAEPIDLRVLRNANSVITPLEGTTSLIEALGTRSIVFDPFHDPYAVSPLWRLTRTVLHTQDTLAEALGADGTAINPSLAKLAELQIATDFTYFGHATHTALFGES